MNFYFATVFVDYNIKPTYLKQLPVPDPDTDSRYVKKQHNRIDSAVESILQLHKDLAAAKTPGEQISIERQIASTDAEIDRLVYELYGLTEEEIAIVEEATRGRAVS